MKLIPYICTKIVELRINKKNKTMKTTKFITCLCIVACFCAGAVSCTDKEDFSEKDPTSPEKKQLKSLTFQPLKRQI